MSKLSDLPNIGKVLEQRLKNVEIENIDDLKKEGSKNAFIKLRLNEGDTCINALNALEGAIQGVRWHYLDENKKKELKEFFNSL